MKKESYFGGVPASYRDGDGSEENRGRQKPPKPGEPLDVPGGTDGVQDDEFGRVTVDSRKLQLAVGQLARKAYNKNDDLSKTMAYLHKYLRDKHNDTHITRHDVDVALNKRPIRNVAKSIPDLDKIVDGVFNILQTGKKSEPGTGGDTQKAVK